MTLPLSSNPHFLTSGFISLRHTRRIEVEEGGLQSHIKYFGFSNVRFNIIPLFFCPHLGLKVCLFLSVFLPKTVCTLHISSMRATCPIDLIM
jgi:hypothetical protein